MNGSKISEFSPPVAKRMRHDRPNTTSVACSPLKSTYSLSTCLQKVRHLLGNPPQIQQLKKAQPAKRNVKLPPQQSHTKCQYGRSFLVEEALRKVRHLLSEPPKVQHDNKSEIAEEIEDSDPTQSLMILVDDCLLAIFDYLNPADLISVAHTNVRLNRLVKYYIQLKNKIQFVPNSIWIQRGHISVEVLHAFLGIFGEKIHSLALHRKSFDNKFNDFGDVDRILRFIQKYCNLTEMTLIGFGMCGLTQDFCAKLESLTLGGCSVTRDWKNMRQLKTLKLNEVIFRAYPYEHCYDREFYMPKKPIQIPFGHFGALEQVQLKDVNVTNENVVKLINSNRKLKSLSVVKCRELSAFIINAVGQLKHLEEFEYKTKKGNAYHCFSPLTSLKKLKVLKLTQHTIMASQMLFEKFVANGIALNHLELGLTPMNSSLAVSIVKMQSITILKLNDLAGLNESHVTGFANQLKSLQELHVKTISTISQNGIKNIVHAANQMMCFKLDAPGIQLDAATYQSILLTVQARESQAKLELTIYGYANQLVVLNDILKSPNEEWLTVKELDRNEHHLFEDLTSKIGPPPPRRSYYSDSDDSDYDYY